MFLSALLVLFCSSTFAKDLLKEKGFVCWRYHKRDADGKYHCSEGIGNFNTSDDCCQAGGSGYTEYTSSFDSFKYNFGIIRKPECKICKGAKCLKIKCKKFQKCKDSHTESSRCSCQPDCSDLPPGKVCGSDNKTYKSECDFQREICEGKFNLQLSYRSECKRDCIGVQCMHGKQCIPTKDGASHCVERICPSSCDGGGPAVCGVDGKTYESQCHLQQAGCKMKKFIMIAHMGKCNGAGSCSNIQCPNNKKCVLHSSGQPRCIDCECIVFPFLFKDFCGSDGQQYSSWCDLKRASCKKGILITPDFIGKACKSR